MRKFATGAASAPRGEQGEIPLLDMEQGRMGKFVAGAACAPCGGQGEIPLLDMEQGRMGKFAAGAACAPTQRAERKFSLPDLHFIRRSQSIFVSVKIHF